MEQKSFIDKALERIKKEVLDIESREDLTRDEKIENICRIFGTFCGAVAVQPIPFADIFVLTPIQVYMGKKIADIHGYHLQERDHKEIVKEISATVGLGLLSQQLVIGAYKTFIPFLGAFTTIPLVFGLTYGMGKVMDYYFDKKKKGEKISEEEMKSIFKSFNKKGKDIGKENRENIKDALK